MTYRAGRSYVRFPESVRTLPERSLKSSSALMDQLLQDDKHKNHLHDQPAVVTSQNVYDAIETKE